MDTKTCYLTRKLRSPWRIYPSSIARLCAYGANALRKLARAEGPRGLGAPTRPGRALSNGGDKPVVPESSGYRSTDRGLCLVYASAREAPSLPRWRRLGFAGLSRYSFSAMDVPPFEECCGWSRCGGAQFPPVEARMPRSSRLRAASLLEVQTVAKALRVILDYERISACLKWRPRTAEERSLTSSLITTSSATRFQGFVGREREDPEPARLMVLGNTRMVY